MPRRQNEFEFRHGKLTATVRCSVGRTWYIILTNEANNKAWTSGVYGKKEALADAVDFISGEKPLPTTMLGKIPECKEEFTGTIEQNKRTCNFCMRRYPADLFRAHWDVCPGRHMSGMMEPR
jgi:hypothetical protein